jgi:hypothetical protein
MIFGKLVIVRSSTWMLWEGERLHAMKFSHPNGLRAAKTETRTTRLDAANACISSLAHFLGPEREVGILPFLLSSASRPCISPRQRIAFMDDSILP